MTEQRPDNGLPPTASVADGQGVGVSAQLRGEVMAFAAQSAVTGLLGNIYEPYINHRVQKYLAPIDEVTHKAKFGSYGQNLGGELVGDFSGAGTLMLAELLCPKAFHATSRKFRSFVDPLYDSVARRVFAADAGRPDYEQKVDEWKTFQERNLSRSLVIAAGAVAGDIATQKWIIKNPAPLKTIFAGKMCATGVGMVVSLCSRLAFPKQLDALDARIGSKFARMFKQDEAAPAQATEDSAGYAERLRKQTDAYVAAGHLPENLR